ncbi:MAG: hypothetical protein ACLTYN_02280 [Dysosmobacter welbionis]
MDRFACAPLQHSRPDEFLVGIMAVVFVLDLFSQWLCRLYAVLQHRARSLEAYGGWVTWMFLPTNGSLFWILISLSFYYLSAPPLRVCKAPHYALFYLACAVLMVVFGMISILWSPLPVVAAAISTRSCSWPLPCTLTR